MSSLFYESYSIILHELEMAIERIPSDQVEQLMQAIPLARKTLVVGAGRMGILLSTFSMRLNHLGFSSHVVGSTNCPPIAEQDLLLVASSSGETPTIREIVREAKDYRARIAAITASPSSSIASMASLIVHLQAPSSLVASKHDSLVSRQPMKTLFEQSLFIVLEAIVLALMEQTGQTASDMASRHGNLE